MAEAICCAAGYDPGGGTAGYLFLTVRGDSNDIVSGFRKGADDYVVKPFELEILYSRICALLRRAGNVSGQYLTCDRISLDQSGMMVFLGKRRLA